MIVSEYAGSPEQIGVEYGKKFSATIQKNISMLVKRFIREQLPLEDRVFIEWVDNQENIILKNWPWLIEEMRGVAEGSSQTYRNILLLNLRVWQYDLYCVKPNACSSMVIVLADGSLANAGALDDPRDLYCGLVKVVPNNGYSYFTFPITGTCWAIVVLITPDFVSGYRRNRLRDCNHCPVQFVVILQIVLYCRPVRQ